MMSIAILAPLCGNQPDPRSQIQFPWLDPAYFTNSLSSRQAEPNYPTNIGPQAMPYRADFIITQSSSSGLRDRWALHSIKWIIIKITSSYRPSDHCAHILKDTTGGYWGIRELSVDYAGNVCAHRMIATSCSD